MKQYLDLLTTIKEKGVEKSSARNGMPNTIGVHGHLMRMDLTEGFPLLTTKKMYWKGIVTELLWFMNGGTNIKYLVDNGCNIWTADCYRWFKQHNPNHVLANIKGIEGESESEYNKRCVKEFGHFIKTDEQFAADYGNLGRVNGAQWRDWRGTRIGSGGQLEEVVYDQVGSLIKGLRDKPMSRYHIISGWNPTELSKMALPPCHLLYQFHCRPMNKTQQADWAFKNYGKDWKKNKDVVIPELFLDLTMYQRSCDTFLGVPFNIASMSLMVEILAKMTGMVAGDSVWMGGDTHVYTTHLEQMDEQISREPMKLPKMKISDEVSNMKDPSHLKVEHFELVDYKSHPSIKADLSVGL